MPALWAYARRAGAWARRCSCARAWEVVGDVLPEEVDAEGEGEVGEVGVKRGAPVEDGAPPPKRARTDLAPSSPSEASECTKPAALPRVSALLARYPASLSLSDGDGDADAAAEESACDLFLSPGFRARWCRCLTVHLPSSFSSTQR
jgi:hypothetical protein